MLRKLVYPCIVVLLPFLMWIQMWHGDEAERTYFNGDVEDSYYPDLRVIELALFDGEFPLWNPYDRAGYPFSADPQTGVLYPLNWLLAVIGHLGGGVSLWLTTFKMILHVSIAGLGMYLFLREREQPEPAAAVAAVSYQFGSYFATQVIFSLAWPLAWTPSLMHSLDRLFAQPTPRRAVVVAACMGMMATAGSPPGVFYGALIAAPYVVLRLVESLRGARLKPWLTSTGLQLLFAGALGGIVSLPQLLATTVLIKQSVLEKATFGHASSGSLNAADLLSLAVRSLGDYYAGICALFLALLGALYHRERRDVVLFLALIVFGLLMMLGTNTQLFQVAYDLIPGVDKFRLCFRYVALVSFGVSVLASYGVSALLERAVSARTLRSVAVCALVLLALALYLSSLRPDAVRDPWISRDLTMIGILLAFAVVLAHGILRQRGSRALLCAAMLGLCALDYAAVIPRMDAKHHLEPYADLLNPEQREQLRSDLGSQRVFNAFALHTWRPGSLNRFRDFNGYYDPLLLRRYALALFEQLKFSPARVMALFSVKYYAHSPRPADGFTRHFVPNPEQTPGFKRLQSNLYEVADPAPNAYWVGQIDLRPDDGAARAELARIDHHKYAVLAESELKEAQRDWARSLHAPARPSVAARVLERGYNHVTFAVNAPAEGLLVMNEAWFPGWVADLDGSAAPLLHVNSMMQGVRVAAGEHHVALRFRPYYFLVPAWLAALSVLAVALGFALHWWRSRQQRE